METPRVAIVGASGIGRYHAKWFHLAGCDVVAFLGRSSASCHATTIELCDLFGFTGQGYTSLDRLLEVECPDVVDVCVPNHMHFDCAMAAFDAGAHVLCEKPLVWHTDLGHADLLNRARTMVDRARNGGRHFGVCTQYAAAVPHYHEFNAADGSPRRPEVFRAEMETLERGRKREPLALWVDMGPHPLSLLLSWMPEGQVVANSVCLSFRAGEAAVGFEFADRRGCCHCEIVVRNRPSGIPVRRFGVDHIMVDCTGRNDEKGVYTTVLSRDGRESVSTDYMSQLIRHFADAVRGSVPDPLVSGVQGLRNLELQQELMPDSRRDQLFR